MTASLLQVSITLGSTLADINNAVDWMVSVLSHLIPARRPDILIVNKRNKKRTYRSVDFSILADHREKNQRKRKERQVLGPCQKIEKTMEHEGGGDTNCTWCTRNNTQRLGAFGTITKGLLKGLDDLKVGGRVVTIQTKALLRTARTLRRVLVTWGDLLSLKIQWKIISVSWCEKL